MANVIPLQSTHAHTSMFSQTWHNLYPVEHKSLAINRLPVIRPFGLWKPAPIVICSDIKEVPDVSSA